MKNCWFPQMIITHKGCMDGIAAAWVVYKFLDSQKICRDQVELVQMNPNGPFIPAGVEGKRVLMVDISYNDPNMMTELQRLATEVVLLDHHKSAALYEGKIPGVIDMDRSGAQIAWDFFFPGSDRPGLVNYVGDRDLWKFVLPLSKEINSYLYFEEPSIARMDQLDQEWDSSRYAEQGKLIELVHRNIRNALSTNFRRAIFTDKQGKTYQVMVGDCPWIFRSDLGNQLMEANPELDFVILYTYFVDGKSLGLSLRGKDKVDLSALAQQFGGGGHPNASAFRSTHSDFLTFLSPT